MMQWQYTPYVLPLIVSAAVSTALAFLAWRRRSVPGAAPVAWLMLAVVEWSLAYALELGGVGLRTKVFWVKVEYLGIVAAPAAWLAFVLQYTDRGKWLTRRNAILLAVVPLVTLLQAWTNESHGLMWSEISLDASGSFEMLDLAYGGWWWINTAYSYGLLVFGTGLLVQTVLRSPHLYRRQAAALLTGVLAPWVGNVLYIFDLGPFPHLDLTPSAFTLTGLALTWSLLHYRLFDIVPIARGVILESMDDSVMVLDAQNRVVDANLAATRAIGRQILEIIGQPVEQVLSAWPDLIERYRDVTEMHTEIDLDVDEMQRRYDLRISPLFDRRGHVAGRLLVSRDITERKRAEEEARRYTAQLETLRQVGLELTSQLDLDTLLRSIVSRAIELLGGSGGGLDLYRPERDVLERAVSIGLGSSMPAQTVVRRGEGLSGNILETGEPMIVDDYRHWEGRASDWEDYPVKAVVGVPVHWSDKFLGVLIVLGDPPRTFSAADAELLSLLATRAAIAVENSRLFQAEREQRELAEALEQAAAAVNSTLELDQVFDRILEQVERVVAGDAFNIMLLGDGVARSVRWRGYDSLGLEDFMAMLSLPIAEYPNLARMVESGESVVVPDVAADPTWTRTEVPDWLHSYVGAPIRVGGVTVGLLNVDGTKMGQFGPADARRLQTFANHAATAIENARLYRQLRDHADRLEQRVQERTAELQAQYARLDAILHSTADGIVVADTMGEILQANPVAQVWLTQMLSLQEAVRSVATRAAERPVQVLELPGLDLELSGAPISEPERNVVLRPRPEEPVSGEPAAVVAIHDVSHLKALDRMRTRFVTNVSHELRTPITTIRVYADLLRRTPPESEKWSAFMDKLVQETDRQVQLGEDILQMTRIYAGRLKIRPRPTSLNELSETVAADHRLLAQERGLTLEHRPADPGPVALVDAQNMAQMLNTLVEDAIRYTPAGGGVVVSTGEARAEGRVWATVTVSDTGERIPAEDLLYIFERFFREEEPRSERVSKTGLRLMILKGIMELHGGQVTVESEESVGSTFTLWLPLGD